MKKIYIINILLLTCSLLYAQKVVSPGGETQTISGYEISWTLGEVAIETVSDETTILSQGFQQSNLEVNPQTGIQLVGIDLKVFPNPTENFINVQFGQAMEKVSYEIYNNMGSLVAKNEITSTNTKLNFTSYASGQYILKLIKNTNEPIQTFKIIKR